MSLPQKLPLELMQPKWASIIDPVLRNPSINSVILQNISLVAGANVVNHTLGRALTGWRVIRIRAISMIYDTQDLNPMPELTLQLTSSDPVVVNLEVF